jgi:hypothetical protein
VKKIILLLVIASLFVASPLAAEEKIVIKGNGNYATAEVYRDGELVRTFGGVMKLYPETESVPYYTNPNYPYATFKEAYQKAELDLMKSKTAAYLSGSILLNSLMSPPEFEENTKFQNVLFEDEPRFAVPVGEHEAFDFVPVVNPGYDTTRGIRIAAVLAWLFSLAILLVVLHVIMRRVRKLEEMIVGDNDKMKNNLVKIGEWMVHFDIGLSRLFEKTGLMPEGASLDETLEGMKNESFTEMMTRLSLEGSGFDQIEEIEPELAEVEEIEESGIPDLQFAGDWRKTEAYVGLYDNEEGC